MATAPKFPKMAVEFPAYDQSGLPDIPPAFADESWRNDACPSFYAERLALKLWVDHADAAEREAGGPRYSLHREKRRNGSPFGHLWDGHLIDSDEWPDVLAAIRTETVDLIARRFAEGLLAELDSDKFAIMAIANRDNIGRDVCASHDHCDSNMVMLAAFESVMGHKPLFLADPESDIGEADRILWNDAWERARAEYITATESEAELYREIKAKITISDYTPELQNSLGDVFCEIESRFADHEE